MYELKVIRKRREGYADLTQFRTAREVFQAFRKRFERADREEFLVLLLDSQNKLLGFNVVSVGTLTTSFAQPREIFKAALLSNAAVIVLLHNHVSGDPTPSAQDLSITKRLRKVGQIMGIPVLDHIVIGEGRYISFLDEGLFSLPTNPQPPNGRRE